MVFAASARPPPSHLQPSLNVMFCYYKVFVNICCLSCYHHHRYSYSNKFCEIWNILVNMSMAHPVQSIHHLVDPVRMFLSCPVPSSFVWPIVVCPPNYAHYASSTGNTLLRVGNYVNHINSLLIHKWYVSNYIFLLSASICSWRWSASRYFVLIYKNN